MYSGVLVNLAWSLLIVAFGACVGSFLNVVIFRWPRDMSLRRPLWSFCPTCRSTLSWRDNLPVVSYILLGGRCRYCRTRISLQYPLVELATAFTFLLIFDAFFVAKFRGGITDMAVDWPMLLAHWALAAGLIVIAVMDLEAYIVDIRVTWILTGLGLLFHSLWTPWSSTMPGGWIRPGPYLSAMAVAAVVGLAVAALIWLRPRRDESTSAPPPPQPEPPRETVAESTFEPPPADAQTAEPLPQAEPQVASEQPVSIPAAPRSYAWLWAVLGGVVVAGYIAAIVVSDYQAWVRLTEPTRDAAGRLQWESAPAIDPALIRTGAGLILLFVAMTLFASHPHPEEDQEIVEAIEAEAVGARRVALGELVFLSPTVLLMVVALVVLIGNPLAAQHIERVLMWEAVGHWKPLLGLATALAGWMIGGALAWATRVFGTLGLGKEAFGMGDVHIMAAIGAIAGGAVAFIGFFAASLLALLGMMVILFRRQGRALPYGPWLALACYIVVIYLDKILNYLQVAGSAQ